MTLSGRMFRCQILLLGATLAACGSSQLSRAAIESEVAKQSLDSLNKHGLRLSASATCAETPNQPRTYDCRVTVKNMANGHTSPSQEVTAVVSNDGKSVVVQGL